MPSLLNAKPGAFDGPDTSTAVIVSSSASVSFANTFAVPATVPPSATLKPSSNAVGRSFCGAIVIVTVATLDAPTASFAV